MNISLTIPFAFSCFRHVFLFKAYYVCTLYATSIYLWIHFMCFHSSTLDKWLLVICISRFSLQQYLKAGCNLLFVMYNKYQNHVPNVLSSFENLHVQILSYIHISYVLHSTSGSYVHSSGTYILLSFSVFLPLCMLLIIFVDYWSIFLI